MIQQYLSGSFPSKRTHGKVVVIPAVIYLQLPAEVLKGIKGVGGIEAFVVLPVAAIYLSVMPGCVRLYQLVADAMVLQMHLKEGWLVPIGGKTVGELRPIVGLDTLYRERKSL